MSKRLIAFQIFCSSLLTACGPGPTPEKPTSTVTPTITNSPTVSAPSIETTPPIQTTPPIATTPPIESSQPVETTSIPCPTSSVSPINTGIPSLDSIQGRWRHQSTPGVVMVIGVNHFLNLEKQSAMDDIRKKEEPETLEDKKFSFDKLSCDARKIYYIVWDTKKSTFLEYGELEQKGQSLAFYKKSENPIFNIISPSQAVTSNPNAIGSCTQIQVTSSALNISDIRYLNARADCAASAQAGTPTVSLDKIP